MRIERRSRERRRALVPAGMYGTGVNWAGEIVDLGSEAGVVEKSGAYYSWKGERIAQGRDNVCKCMVENPQAADEIRARRAGVARVVSPAATVARSSAKTALQFANDGR